MRTGLTEALARNGYQTSRPSLPRLTAPHEVTLPGIGAVQYWSPADKAGKRDAVHLYIRDGLFYRVYFVKGTPDRYAVGTHEHWNERPLPISNAA